MKNFLLPWLNVEKSPLGTLPNNPLNKLEQSSSFNTPDGGFLYNKAPMTPIPRMSSIPKQNPPASTPNPAPMSISPILLGGQHSIPEQSQLPSFTDFQNQNFIPDPLKSFTPSYNVSKPKLEIPSEQSKINEKNKVISNDYNTKRNAMYAFMADVQKNDGGMTREMIEEHYPEFADNIESVLQLQAEIAPIVSKGEAVKLSEIQKYYPELLSGPKFLKKSEVKKKDNEAKEYLKKISKVDQSVLSDEGKKWLGLMQGMQELAIQTRMQYQVPKDITDTEITNYLISNNPELKKRYQEGINTKLTDYDKAQLKLGGNWMSRFSATAQNLTHRANTWLSENVIEPYMQASEQFKEAYPNLSVINAPVKALLQIPGGLLHGTDKALSNTHRLANADYQSAGEIVGGGIKGLGGAGEIAFNTALAPLTAKFHTLGGTKAGKAVLDNTFGLLEEGLENIFQAPGVNKLYNALDEEARADLKNGIIIGLLHKGNKATEKTRFNAKMAIKTATDAFNNAIQKGINSGRFQIWVEKGLAHENGRFQDGALGRIVKEGVSEFQSAFKENFGKFSDVLKTRRQQVNTLTDQRGFIETTKSEIKEGVESVKKGAKNVGSAIKAETEDLVGGIKKKINDLNTKSPVKQEGEIKVGSAGSEGKINEKDFTQKFSNFNRKFLQNQNRIDPSKIVEFEKRTGKKYGDYMLERGRVGGPEENIAKMTEYINNLKEQKKQAFEKMSGTAQSEAIGTLLTDIVERATQVRDPQSGKFTTMLTKHNEGGISFSELEEAKRRYERNIKTGYYKDNNSVGIQRATNLDTEIRQYQQQEALKQGFANIKELNKEISNAYFLSDNILKKQLKMDANNQVSLTDYLLLGAMPDNATGFAGLALKIAMKNKSVKNTMLHAVARLFGNHKNSKEIKVDLEKIEKMADQRSVADAIERFMKKWEIEEPKALPMFPQPTVIGKNGPQVKNPLSPQPTRKSVIELDKRPNMLGDTIPRNSKKIDKKPENIIGLKTMKKTGNPEKSEYTTSDASNASSVSLTEKKNKVTGAKIGSSGATARGGNSGRPTTDFSNLEKTKTKGGYFDLSGVKEEYQRNYDKIVNREGDHLEVGRIDGKVAYDGKERPAIFSQAIQRKIVGDHGLDKANLLATVNEPDYIIKNIDGKADKINIIKKIEGTNDFVLIGADRQNGYFILSNYEVKSRNNKRLIKSLGRGDVVIDNVGDSSNLKPKNIIGLKHSPRERVDTSNTETKHEKEKIFETLPEDVSVFDESKKLGPKRIAPDRKTHQQLDPQTAMEKLAEAEKKLRENKVKNLQQDLEKYRSIMKKYDGKLPARTEKNRAKYPDLIREYGEIQQFKKQYLLAGEITKSQNIEQTIEGMIEFNKNKIESITPERMKERYIELVQQDLSKGYKYPEAVLNFIPEARKILNGRERYEKGLHTSFSAKDERINYEHQDTLGVGMKRQDGKELTLEQKQDIIEGVKDFEESLGLDMKKLGEEKQWVYVHLNGKNVFLKNGVGGLYREKGENISISVGGTETVRQTLGGGASSIKVHTVMSHELGHALDAIQNWKLFPSSKLFDLKLRMNKAPTSNVRYWKSDAEITARAIEQYVGIKKGNTNYYEKPAYWKKEVYETIIEPMIKESIEKKFKGYKKGDNQTGKSLPKGSHEGESAMIWVSDKTSKKIHELTEKYPSAGKNELAKMEKLNSKIKKGSGKRTDKDKEIYRVKDDILLDDIIEKGISIKDEGPNTTYTLEQDGVYVTWHLGDRVMRILREKGLLK